MCGCLHARAGFEGTQEDLSTPKMCECFPQPVQECFTQPVQECFIQDLQEYFTQPGLVYSAERTP